MQRFSIIFKRDTNTLEQTFVTCTRAELNSILEYMEIYENNILSIVEVN